MILPTQAQNLQVKPRWVAPAGIMESVVAFNCRKYGMPRPVLAMPMWEGAGNRAIDLSGHGNHGAITGSDWVANGLELDGVGDYINIAAASSLDTGNTCTISLWAKRDDALLADYMGLVVYRYDAHDSQYAIYYDTDERIAFWIMEGATWYGFIGTAQIQDTDMHHIVFVWNGSNAWIYIDGNLDKTGAFAHTPTNVTETLRIGSDQVGGRDFAGTVNNVSIFNTPLSVKQTDFIHHNPYFMYRMPEELYGYTAAVGGLSIPVAMHHYNQMMRA